MSDGSPGEHHDFGALAATAEPFDPKRPARQIALAREPQSFVFELDNGRVKLVTLRPRPDGLAIAVRYATGLDGTRTLVPTESLLSIVADAYGLVIEWREPLLPWFRWLTGTKRRRF